MRFERCALVLLFSLFAPAVHAAPTTIVTDVATGRGTSTIRIAHFRADAPIANLIVLPGGNGLFELQTNGTGNSYFLLHTTSRNRGGFVDAGISVILVDSPSDRPTGITNEYRLTGEHATELRNVLAEVRARDNVPTWVIGGSLGSIDATALALSSPEALPIGLILVSPFYELVLAQDLEGLRRPTLLLTHQSDSCIGTLPHNAPLLMQRLTGAPAKQHVEYSGGGGPAGCDATGPHGLGGLDADFITEVSSWIQFNSYLVQAANYQGLWFRPSESGWGVNITQQGEILFATWFSYDVDGVGMWLVAPDVRKIGTGAYTGALYRTTGPSFDAVPFDPARIVVTAVGTATFTFADANNGTFGYSVGTVSQSKPIERQVFSTPVPVCAPSAGATPVAGGPTWYQDLWWRAPAGSESGWGVNITHQGDILFATWFTYGADGRGQWLVMPDARLTSPGTYTGPLYRTRGPAFSSAQWNPASVTVTQVGTGTFTFASESAGTFAYTLDGVSQSKAIVRQIYATPPTVCR